MVCTNILVFIQVVGIPDVIVQERTIRQLSIMILSARHPSPVTVDADEQAFFIDTNQSFIRDWAKNCCLHIPIFQVPMP
jgi:hypothetical protein